MLKISLKNILIIGLSIGILLGTFVIFFSRDVSLDYRVWLNVGSREVYHKGDFIRMKFNRPDKYIQNKWLIKQITCGPNDILDLFGDKITCNNIVIAKVLNKAKNGDTLKGLSFSGKIPKDYYFIQGNHERSYDSRYFGLVYKKEISSKVIPLRSLVW